MCVCVCVCVCVRVCVCACVRARAREARFVGSNSGEVVRLFFFSVRFLVRILVRSIFSLHLFPPFLAGSSILSKNVVCVVVLVGCFFCAIACMAVNNIYGQLCAIAAVTHCY